MTDISYTIKGIEKSFSCDLPESFHCRLDWNSYQLMETSLDDDYEGGYPKNMYHFVDFNCLDNPLFSFISLYRDSIIETTDELDQVYEELVDYYDPHVYKDPNDLVIFEAFYSENLIVIPEELEDYVPPVEVEDAPLEGAVGDQLIEVPPVEVEE